jgi:hypothetical protein
MPASHLKIGSGEKVFARQEFQKTGRTWFFLNQPEAP